jgi:uncharacterized protein YecT (DUF1311 family)
MFTAALLGTTAIAALADTGECAKYKTSYDQTYCFAKLFLASDQELNTVYNDLRSAVKAPVREKLKETQLEWMKYRDQSCENSGTINVDCNYRVNRDRTEYLRDRLREFKAGTCRDDMIGQQSWK